MRLFKWLLILYLVGFNANSIAQINTVRIADSILNKHAGFNGVILLADHDQTLYYQSFGYRDFAAKTPLLNTDIFELASVSKQFTAFVIMKLREKNQLSYDDSIDKWLDLPYKGITVRQLLTHTSGLPDYQEIMDRYWDKSKVAGNNDILEYLRKYAPPVLFKPGEKYEYSNTGYVLLASIAEKISGRDFISLCREWIFKPAKMSGAYIRNPQEKKATANFTVGHIYVDSLHRYVRADSFPSSDYTIWLGNRKGPGRVSARAIDLLLWDQDLYTTKLISQNILSEAYKPMRLNSGSLSDYGFGWDLEHSAVRGRIVEHTGDNPGYRTLIIRYLDQRKTLIILSNNEYSAMGRLANELQYALFGDK